MVEDIPKAACSGAEIYRKSDDRLQMLDPGRADRGPVYAKFMQDFWQDVDTKLAAGGKPSTVGGALDLVQSAFLDAQKTNATDLKGIGIKAKLDVDWLGRETDFDAKQLLNEPLSSNKDVQRSFGDSTHSGVDVGVKFERQKKDWVFEPIINQASPGTLVGDPVSKLAPASDTVKSNPGVPDLYTILHGCKET